MADLTSEQVTELYNLKLKLQKLEESKEAIYEKARTDEKAAGDVYEQSRAAIQQKCKDDVAVIDAQIDLLQSSAKSLEDIVK